MYNNTHNEVAIRIKRMKRGAILFPSDFHGIGNTATIRTVLYRLVKEGILIRLGQGLFLYPKTDPELGILYPSLEEIAHAIARRDKVQIKPTGAHAMQSLGLSTQVPMKVVFLTDGRSKQIKIGNHTITFKKTTPKKLAAKGKISSKIILALEEMGRNNKIDLTEDLTKRLKEFLVKEDINVLLKDLKTAPSWIANIIVSILFDQNKSKND